MTLSVKEEATFRASKDAHTRKFGTELVILELSRGEYFSLDELGARIWQELVAGRSVREVLEALVPDYDEPANVLRADLLSLVEDLIQHGLLASRHDVA
jgi:hypothetical protein